MTLVEFLMARLDEDEVPVRELVAAPWNAHQAEDFHGPVEHDEYALIYVGAGRLLREVEAKRAIVTELAGPPPWRSDDHLSEWAVVVLVPLAAVYSDHPDYRDEWRP